MKTDGLFDFRCVEIPAVYNKPINLIFRGDVHFNSPAFARREFEDDSRRIQEIPNPKWFISTGYVFESLSTSERHFFSNGDLHDSNRTRWEKEYAREIDEYAKLTHYQINKTLAVFGGNHYFQFYDGVTSDMALASKWKAPYIGVCGYIILTLKFDEYHSQVVKIFVHHGKASGNSAASGFLALERASSYFSDADIVVMGHDHKAGAMKISALNCDMGRGGHWKVKSKDRIIGRSGCYLKSYEAGAKSYSVDAMYRPSSLGFLQVVITPRRQNWGRADKNRKDAERHEEKWVELNAII